MDNYRTYFKGKKITQLGLGLLGRGLGDAIFLAECGAELIVTDLKTEEELKTSVEKLKQYSNLPAGQAGVTLHLGGHNLEDFRGRDFILKGAGVPLDSIYIEEARKNNIPIEMDASLFCKLLPKEISVVGVTGTRGKSTTTHLINHILKTAGKKTILGGNVRDMATLPYIKDVAGSEIVVLELDSWQLQGFGESKISPHVAVFTTFMPDHLNYYRGDLERYFDDKANIFKYQNENDVLVVGEEVSQKSEFKGQNCKSKIKIASIDIIPKTWQGHLLGEHNKINIACAIEACRALGIPDEDIKKGVETFEGVEGRLQFVRQIRGIKIYNDNNATTPEATIAALKALDQGFNKRIILLCGGADKSIDCSGLAVAINKYCKKVAFLKGSGTDRLFTTLQASASDLAFPSIFTSLDEVVKEGFALAEEGDIVLFSPAFASFGLFKNEYERNDEFMRIVSGLQ